MCACEPVTVHIYASVGRHGDVVHVGEALVDPDATEADYITAFSSALAAFTDVVGAQP